MGLQGKKLLLSVLCAIMMLFSSAIYAKADTVTSEEGYIYEVLEDGTLEIQGYTGSTAELVIPKTIGGMTVTRISNEAFSGNAVITSLEIGSNIQFVGNRAFSSCENLKTVDMSACGGNIGVGLFLSCKQLEEALVPTELDSIPGDMFRSCSSLKTIVVPEGVTFIGHYAFDGCTSLSEVELPDGLEKILKCAFNGCKSLSSLWIPASVTEIYNDSYSGCSGLRSIVVEEGNPVYDSGNGSNAIIETEEETVFLGCVNTTFPDSVSIIGEMAFAGNESLKTLTIPEGIETISYSAFIRCDNLETLNISSTVSTIGGWAFLGCSGLQKIVVDDENAYYTDGNGANILVNKETGYLIQGSANATITSDVKTIGDSSFLHIKGLESVELPSSVESIEKHAFYGCENLKSIQLSPNIDTIWEGAFFDCTSLTHVDIPSGIRCIMDYAFSGCTNLQSISISDSVTGFGFPIFNNVGKNFVIYANPNSKAAEYAKTYHIPIKSPEEKNNTENQEDTDLGKGENDNQEEQDNSEEAAQPAAKGSIIYDLQNDGKYKVTTSKKNELTVAYLGTTDHTKRTIEIPSKVTIDGFTYKVTSVGDGALRHNKKITQITVPNTVKTIGKYAFSDCKKLTKVTIGTGVTAIKTSAFENCVSLKTVLVKSKKLKLIGRDAFYKCKKLTKISLKTTKFNKNSVGKNSLKKTNKKLVIYVPKSKVKKYKKYFNGKGNKYVKISK